MGLLEKIKRWIVRDNVVIEISPSQVYSVSTEEILNHPLFRAALVRIAGAASQVPLKVYDGDREIEHHLNSQFADGFSTPQAIQTIVHDLYLYGNSFWQIKRVGKRVVGLSHIPFPSTSLNPDGSLHVFTDTGGVDLKLGEDVLWFKFVNPADPAGLGLSIAQTIAAHIKTLIEIDKVCYEFLSNGALPFAVLKLQSPMEREMLEREREKLKAMFGRGNRFGWMVTSQGVSIEPINTQLRIGDLPEVRRTLREEILSVLNVPPAVLGFYEYANYANAREQTKIFWRETVIPLLNLIAETINFQYLSKVKPTLWCEFDLTSIPYTKERLDEVASSLRGLVESGILTINEAREVLGFNEPLEWGDTWWGNLNTVPIAEKGDEE